MPRLDPASCRVILVGPENALNVGFVARAMQGFGVKELVLADSKWKAVPPKARVTGVAALDILDAAAVAPSLSDALRGCETAIAFSRRPTTLRQESFTLPEAPALKRTAKTALVFGRESNGLTREEAALCPFLARIPSGSLNLSQAVAVALFSLTAAEQAKEEAKPAREEVGVDRMLGLWDFLEPKLKAAPRFTDGRLQRLRQMLYGLRLDDRDFDLLFAVMNELAVPAAERRALRALKKRTP